MIEIDVNNGQKLVLRQYKHDKTHGISVQRVTPKRGNITLFDVEETKIIPEKDVVMLLNLYRYVKDNDIYNEFINPNGKEVE